VPKSHILHYDERMSSLISCTDSEQALVLTDTLAVVDGKPFKFTTKAHIVPHINVIVAGTGVGAFADWWFVEVNTKINVQGIDGLNTKTSNALADLWVRFNRAFEVGGAKTLTIYHFGFSEVTGLMKTFVYRSETGFQSEPRATATSRSPL